MPLMPTLFTSPAAQRDLTKFGPTHWNNVTGLLTRLLDGADADGLVLTRDSGSVNGASWQSPVASRLLPADGSATAPAYSFASDPDTGLYVNPASSIRLRATVDGSDRLGIDALVAPDIDRGNRGGLRNGD